VLDAFSSEAMTPCDALNSTNEGNVRSVQNKVVHIAARVRCLDRGDLARLGPFTVNSEGMTLGNSEATRELKKALRSRARDLGHADDSGKSISNDNLVSLADIFD
jgi:hypothetical protein